MLQENRLLYEEIERLPLEKVGKALSYVRYLEKETDDELFLSLDEEKELHDLRLSDDFVSSADLLAKIQGLPND